MGEILVGKSLSYREEEKLIVDHPSLMSFILQ